MMSQHDKFKNGPLAETEIQIVPSNSEDRVLSRLNKDFRLSKAQQILRLLKDQDDLNQRFRDCALLEDDGGGGEGNGRRKSGQQDEDNWSLHEENHSESGDSEDSENEAERRAARRVALRKHRNSIDPGRCKTSMGFYNEAEVTEIPYDTDSDNVPGLDSACSTPRGVSSGALSARHAPTHLHYGGLDSGVGSRNSSLGYISGAASSGIGGAGGSVSSSNFRLRAYHIKMGESAVGDNRLRDSASFFPDECVVQSARSSRPKTSLVSNASSRSRYYRQQPHPEAKSGKKAVYNNHHHLHNNSSHNPNNSHHNKGHHILQHFHHHQHHQQQQQVHQQQHPHQGRAGAGVNGMGDTRQSIISRLDPNHPMAVRPFCESKAAASEEVLSPRTVSIQQIQQQPSSQPSTPRGGGGGEPHTPRSGSRSNPTCFKHTEVTLFDMAPASSPSRSNKSRRANGGNSPRGPQAAAAVGAGSGGVARSMSFVEHPRMLPVNRTLLSVDSSPLQPGDASPRPGGGAESDSRGRQRPTRVKKRVVGEMQSRGTVATSMHMIGERAHPSMTVMKLPPLESSVNKGGGSSRDLVCVGKD